MPIDLRSDTITRPTPAMIEVMFKAKVGDDVFGDDPAVNKLQQLTADYFGMEAGLFFPSGTMANQVAIKTHTQPGDEIICDQTSHVYRYEGGGIAFHSGASVRLLFGERGIFTPDDVVNNINNEDVHFPNTRLVTIENTVNKGGGICWTEVQLSTVCEVAHNHNLKTHLDGARLWNAIIKTGQNPKDYGKWFDTISVCFSKGLGCPVGSVLVGSKDFIAAARKHRKRFGGGMRQAGYLAAACIYALQNNITRLTDDHQKALKLETILKSLSAVKEVMPVQTNIVLFKTESVAKAEEILKLLKEQNILAAATGGGWVRFVTHLDISSEMMEQVEGVLKKVLV
ncbi:MAG: threonine aldolase family protein [Bacteroidia bacterium]